MTRPLHVAFLWHMHQPFYKDTISGRYTLPWVRLHAVKDYLHMAELLREHPGVKATFNFVPVLVEQLEDYAAGRAEDEWAALSRKDCFSDEDKRRLLASFFSINWDRFVKRYPPYWRLLQIRNQLDGAVELLSDAYWRDLALWFSLAWIEPETVAAEPALAALVEKGGGFDRADVETVLDCHRRICGQVLPAYRDLAARGQVELSTSPYYHPILPLLIDSRAGREPTPHMTLPHVLFSAPEDAAEQLRSARAKHVEAFGVEPAGLWPSEGAVSHAVAEMLCGFRWVASDEAILARSLGVGIDRDGDGDVTNPEVLYRPYRFADRDLALVFRDRNLSDRIGFVYHHMGGEQAADDLVARLHRIAEDGRGELVPIVLDGENCWEAYPNNGSDFLRALYSRLEADDTIRTVTLSEHLAEHPPSARVERLATGSWIFGNLETWIGEHEQNRAWDYLAMARSRLAAWQETNPDPARSAAAWRELYVAEGSDWFWWYYSHNRFGQEDMFDREFRAHLANVYRLIDLPVPAWLERPISGEPPTRFRLPTGYVTPRLDAEPQAGVEWTNAGYLDALRSTGAMQQGGGVLQRLYFGHNPADLFFRLEAGEDLAPYAIRLYVGAGHSAPRYAGDIAGFDPGRYAWEVSLLPQTVGHADLSRVTEDGGWEVVGHVDELARKGAVLEVGLDLGRLGLGPGSEVDVLLTLAREHRILETLPADAERLRFTL